MTADIARAAIAALERSGPADWAYWFASSVMTLGASVFTWVCAWHAGAALGEYLGRAPWRRP